MDISLNGVASIVFFVCLSCISAVNVQLFHELQIAHVIMYLDTWFFANGIKIPFSPFWNAARVEVSPWCMSSNPLVTFSCASLISFPPNIDFPNMTSIALAPQISFALSSAALSQTHMTPRGGQKTQKLDFELARWLIPFCRLYWFQKYKDELWGPMGSAASRVVLFQ